MDKFRSVIRKSGALLILALLLSTGAHGADFVSGELTSSSPTFDRIFTANVDPDCNAVSTFSLTGAGVYYQVFPIYSPSGQPADIEIVNSIMDTTIALYCNFDPADASQSLLAYDDDGGAGLLSAITPADGAILQPNTAYDLVVSTFNPGSVGTFDVVLGGDLRFGTPQPAPVPTLPLLGFLSLGALVGLFGLRKLRR